MSLIQPSIKDIEADQSLISRPARPYSEYDIYVCVCIYICMYDMYTCYIYTYITMKKLFLEIKV